MPSSSRWMFSTSLFARVSITFPVGEHLWIEHPIDFVFCEQFVEKNLLTFFFVVCLSTLQNTILVGPDKRNLTAFSERFIVDIQTDSIAELRVGISVEVFVVDVVNEGIVVENPASLDVLKEF